MSRSWLWLAFVLLIAGCLSTPTQELSQPTPSPDDLAVANSTWVRTFEGEDYGALFGLTLTPDDGLLAVGATNHLHFPPYSGDVLYMKLTLEGEVLWERTWGGEGYEQALSVLPTAYGGFYLFGETDSYGQGGRDFFLLKIGDSGSAEWYRTYGGSGREWPYGMLQLENGDLLLYGFTESQDDSGRDQYVLRVDSGGEVIWTYVSSLSGEDLVLDALETSNGDFILTVSVQEDGQLVSLDADGNLQWERRYELPGWQYASQIEPADDGGFLLAGFSMLDWSSPQADTWLARCSSDGELVWETSFGSPDFDDYATSMIRLQDGTYLIGAISDGLLLSHIDQTGKLLWQRSLLGSSVYGVMDLLQLDDGGYLVAGLIQLVNGRSYDAVLLRTDAGGWIANP